MTTRSEARTRLRLWLEDPSVGGLWSDAELDEALSQSLSSYGMYSPLESTTTLVAAAGDTTLALPADAGAPGQVVRVTDPNGLVLPRRGVPARYAQGDELAWERWGDDLIFSRQLSAGDYAVRYYGPRSWPLLDADTVPIPDADVPLLLAGAALWAIEERMMQEWKRGPLPARYTTLRDTARQQYRDLLGAFRRRVTSRLLDSTA